MVLIFYFFIFKFFVKKHFSSMFLMFLFYSHTHFSLFHDYWIFFKQAVIWWFQNYLHHYSSVHVNILQSLSPLLNSISGILWLYLSFISVNWKDTDLCAWLAFAFLGLCLCMSHTHAHIWISDHFLLQFAVHVDKANNTPVLFFLKYWGGGWFVP